MRYRYFATIFIPLFVLKLVVLPLTSFPFDFASYVYQVRQFFDYGIDPMFYWNKGVGLLAVFYAQYALYSFPLNLLQIPSDNVFILHTFFKLPFLIADVLLAFYLGKITCLFSERLSQKRLTIILWMASPIAFWMVEVQGQYSILASFLVVFSLYYLLVKKSVLAFVALAIASSVYYYPALFFPFFLAYHVCNNRTPTRKSRDSLVSFGLKAIGLFIGTIVVSFSPFLFSLSRLRDFASGLFHHAAPDAPSAATQIGISDFSLLKLPYFVLHGLFPTNLTAPSYFQFASSITYLGLVIAAIFVLVRLKNIFHNRSFQYESISLIRDMLSVLLVFVLFLGKFQSHYFLWMAPLLLLFTIISDNRRLLVTYFLLSILPLLSILASLNLGIYFLDLIPWGKINFHFGYSPQVLALGGFVSMLVLVWVLIALLKEVPDRKRWYSTNLFPFFALLFGAFFVCMGAYSLVGYRSLLKGEYKNVLASDKGIFSFPFLFEIKNIREVASFPRKELEIPMRKDRQEVSRNNNGPLESNPDSVWHLYSYGSPSAIEAALTPDRSIDGGRVLRLKVIGPGGKGQINMGPQPYGRYLPIQGSHAYTLSARVDTSSLSDSGEVVFSVRFAGEDGMIISGSDQVVATLSKGEGWNNVSADFITMDGYRYVDVLASLNPKGSGDVPLGASVYLDDIKIYDGLMPLSNEWTLGIKSDFQRIHKDILADKVSRTFFKAKINFETQGRFIDVQNVRLNACLPERSDLKTGGVSYYFDAQCLNASNKNQLIAQVEKPQEANLKITGVLGHVDKVDYSSFSHPRILLAFFAFGAIGNLILIWCLVHSWRRLYAYEDPIGY